jgi:uncharacterized protein
MTIYDRSVGQVDVFEQITRQSLEGADMADVIAAINHDFSKILGRTASGTLDLSVDDNGVKYRFDVPETSYGNDLLVSTRRGDFRGSSFTFSIDPKTGYDIEERADGSLVARPKQIRKIYEMGPVTNPAYEATTAEIAVMRCLWRRLNFSRHVRKNRPNPKRSVMTRCGIFKQK